MLKLSQLNFSFLLTTLTISAGCSTFTHEESMQRFVESIDNTVMRQEKITRYLDLHSGVTLKGVKEVRPGIMEYSLQLKYPIFHLAEKRCSFIFVVQKQTGKIIDWRYNGKPERC